jgi:hypothetical protein
VSSSTELLDRFPVSRINLLQRWQRLFVVCYNVRASYIPRPFAIPHSYQFLCTVSKISTYSEEYNCHSMMVKYGDTSLLSNITCHLCGPGSVVGIATAYGLDGPRIESRWGRDFPHQSRPALRPTQPPVQWIPGLSRR